MKLLTIVVPSYNVEKYLSDTLDSIVKCKRIQELEVLVINDGSTDNTLILAEVYQEEYPQSFIVVDKENGGHGSTINQGLSIANGKYFIVIDGDDWVDSLAMDDFINFIEGQTADVIVTGHYRNYITSGVEETYSYKEKKGYKTDVQYLVDHNLRIPMTDICYKTELLRSVNLSIQENTFYVDEEFCSFPFEKAESVVYFSKGFYHYRIGDVNQSISDINTVRRIEHKKRVFYRIMDKLQSANFLPANREYVRRKMVGVANSILLIYYVYFPDKRDGKRQGNTFFRELKKQYPEVAKDCVEIRRIYNIMNVLHLGAGAWKKYQRAKQIVSERTK